MDLTARESKQQFNSLGESIRNEREATLRPDDGEHEKRLNSECDMQPIGDGTCPVP